MGAVLQRTSSRRLGTDGWKKVKRSAVLSTPAGGLGVNAQAWRPPETVLSLVGALYANAKTIRRRSWTNIDGEHVRG